MEESVVGQGSELRNEIISGSFLYFVVIIKSLEHIIGNILLIDQQCMHPLLFKGYTQLLEVIQDTFMGEYKHSQPCRTLTGMEHTML